MPGVHNRFAENPRTRYTACREAEWDLFHSAQWEGCGNTRAAYESHDSGRELFFSLRLWELFKRAKIRSNLQADLRWRTIKPDAEELGWVDKKLTLLRKRGIPLVPQGEASEEDRQWLRDYIKKHARPSKSSISFTSFEKKQGFKLPRSFKDFLTKAGTKTFRDIDGEEGFVARILTPNKFDCKNFRSGIARTEGDPETAVDGIMFAATDHGDCFCFEVKKRHNEYAVVLYDHDYRRFEPYAPNLSACVRRFVGE